MNDLQKIHINSLLVMSGLFFAMTQRTETIITPMKISVTLMTFLL